MHLLKKFWNNFFFFFQLDSPIGTATAKHSTGILEEKR